MQLTNQRDLAICLYFMSTLLEHPDDGHRGDRNMKEIVNP
jgi:hypothetical protein